MRSVGCFAFALFSFWLSVAPAFAAEPSLAAKTYYDEGLRNLKNKEHKEAVSAFRRAIQFAPEYADAWVALGNTHLATGNFGDAVTAFEGALRVQKDLGVAQYNLAYALRKSQQNERAADAYRTYLGAHADDADAQYGLAETLRALGDDREAARAFLQYAALEKRPDRAMWVEKARAEAARLSGKPAPEVAPAPAAAAAPASSPENTEAVSAFSPVEKRAAPRSPSFERGLERLQRQQFLEALPHLEKASQAAIGDPIVQAALAGAYLGLGNAREAEMAYRRALMKAEGSTKAAVQFGLAESLRLQERLNEAEEMYKRTLEFAGLSERLERVTRKRLGLEQEISTTR